MPYCYSLPWLIDQYENGQELSFLYFWGHTPSAQTIDKACLSQWYPASFVVNNITYPTAEHWMMAEKARLFRDDVAARGILAAETPKDAKAMGREVCHYNEDIWDACKYEIVVRGNIHKFNQNRDMGEYLLSTGDSILAEASPVDAVWGIGLPADSPSIKNLYLWRGQNLLGFALMEVRDFLRQYGFFDSTVHNFPAPWEQYPDKDEHDMFWHMGAGEDCIAAFSKAYDALTEREQAIYRVLHPEPNGWTFYAE